MAHSALRPAISRDSAALGNPVYDDQGNECGGIALVNSGNTERTMMLCDYSNSEAIALGKTEKERAWPVAAFRSGNASPSVPI